MEAYSTNSAPLLKLFNTVWGLGFFYLDLRHGPSETTSAAPREGHAIVNCGDALSLHEQAPSFECASCRKPVMTWFWYDKIQLRRFGKARE